jgi:hypothetical protein
MRLLMMVSVLVVFALSVLAGSAWASVEVTSPWWHLHVGARPTVLTPGSERTIVLSATNLGDASVNGSAGSPVVLRDVLPPDVKVELAGYLAGPVDAAFGFGASEGECSVHSVGGGREEVECTYEGVLPPYLSIEARIYVDVEAGALTAGTLTNEAGVSGGGAVSVSSSEPLKIGTSPTEFGVETFEFTPENEHGQPETQAGAHPFQMTTTVFLNAGKEARGKEQLEEREPYFGDVEQPALPEDLMFKLPPGLVGNPSPFAQCNEEQFQREKCPLGAQVGVALLSVALPLRKTDSVPVFNMVPAVGEPARFGFDFATVAVFIDTSVRTGGDYGVTAITRNITEIATLLSSQVTLWGWPGDPRHDNSRGYGCAGAEPIFGACSSPKGPVSAPFLSLPTSCGNPESEPFAVSMEGDSWPGPNKPQVKQAPLTYTLHDALDPSIAMDGCNQLAFEPSIKTTPDVTSASSPTGLKVDVHVPQQEVLNPNGDAEATVRTITVALPEGVAINPAGGDGLQACSEGLVGYTGVGEVDPRFSARTFTPNLSAPF